jgi:hypothetical protein
MKQPAEERRPWKKVLPIAAAAALVALLALVLVYPIVRDRRAARKLPGVQVFEPEPTAPGPGVGGPSERVAPPAPAASLLERQAEEYAAQVPKTVIQLQQFRTTASVSIRTIAGREGKAMLVNLNPEINAWFLLLIQWNDAGAMEAYHLENAEPGSGKPILDPRYPEGMILLSGREEGRCPLWSASVGSELEKAADSRLPYAPVCGGRLFVRNPTEGHKTTLEQVTDLLRRHVWQGEKITTFVRETFYQDAYLNTSPIIEARNHSAGARPRPPGAPSRPSVSPRYSGRFLIPAEMGIDVESETGNQLLIGRWYPAKDLPGVFVSVIQADQVTEEVVENQGKRVNPLDDVESSALVYLVALDLDMFDLGFEMGTEHPAVGWSERVPDPVRDNSLPGPDGIGTLEPLVMTGMLCPAMKASVTATFVGGFKRYHGAFRWGNLALRNHGSHYGFIEHGTVLSKLQPGLATVRVMDDGTVDLKTWTEKDNAELEHIRHARQNGVPIIEYDPATGASVVGAQVAHWGEGNWSGSAEKKLRTVRAGLGLQEQESRRFLIYGYFSAATPSAMARVFQAYLCKYALLLDINALEHTYLAVYRHRDSGLSVQHLIKGMGELDKTRGNQVIPRFVGYPDNRDFFYLLRKAVP